VNELVIKNPAILGKSRKHLKKLFRDMSRHQIYKEEAMELMLQSPKLISVDLKAVLKDIHFLFELYCGFKIHETVKIFRGFPYIVNLQHRKITLFCGQFKKYRLTHK
jgi:hypothetical protein